MLHSRKENLSYALHKPHEQEELQEITHYYILLEALKSPFQCAL